MSSFYSNEELARLGLKAYGKDVFISRKASLYNPSCIIIGNHVRVDDFCILSGKIRIGDYVHISAYSAIFAGDAGVEIGSFSGLSSRCAVYAISDDYSGEFMSNAMAPDKYRNVQSEKVTIGDHVIIGTGSTVLPGVRITDGVAVGCMSLVKESLEVKGIYCGIPVRKIKGRKDRFIELEKEIRDEE